MRTIDTNAKLSALWLFVLLNIIFRDLHQLGKKPFLEMLLTGTYNGIEITEELLLLGGVLAEVPIAMVLCSLLLNRRIVRPVTFVAAFITTATLVSSPPSDMDDVFHLAIELAAMVTIVWIAWMWPEHDRVVAQVGSELDVRTMKPVRPASRTHAVVRASPYVALVLGGFVLVGHVDSDLTSPTKSDAGDRLNRGTVEFVSQTYFDDPVFGHVIEMHNQHLADLRNWRRLFSQHAVELAGLVTTLPGAEALDVDLIREAFASGTGVNGHVSGDDVFEPWTHRWSGMWSNGSSQYHLWDQTQRWEEQWVQAVSQSEVGVVDRDNLEKMLSRNDVDIGINIYTSRTGITGWVSKRQHGRSEWPHIGYLVDATTMIWITQSQDPDQLFQEDPVWFVFLERVDSATEPKRYSVHGRRFVVESGLRWEAEQSGRHHGNYAIYRRPGFRRERSSHDCC
ncbi:MAG: DUF6326 family protein [Polyangiales bacterium]